MTAYLDLSGVRIGMAAVQRVNQGYDTPLTLAQCIEAVEHPTNGAKRADLIETIAYLAAQVSGYQNSADRDATMVIGQMRSALRDYDQRREVEAHRPVDTKVGA